MDPEIHFQPDKKIAFVSEADTLKGIGRAGIYWMSLSIPQNI
jgi:hypothetical protein